MDIQSQISRIQLIMGHPAMKTCLDCNKVYMPMNAITNHLCPFCEVDKIEEVKAGILNVEIEEVSTDNDDLELFDPKHSLISRLSKKKKG